MSNESAKYLKFGSATVLILLTLGYLAYTGVQESKSYYVTIKELRGMGDSAYTKRLRVAGDVVAGSIRRTGTRVEFILVEQDQTLPVVYSGTEAPPDTFKDDSQALADGSFGRDGVFHAKQLQVGVGRAPRHDNFHYGVVRQPALQPRPCRGRSGCEAAHGPARQDSDRLFLERSQWSVVKNDHETARILLPAPGIQHAVDGRRRQADLEQLTASYDVRLERR